MSLVSSLLQRLAGRRTAEQRWDERWADPAFYSTFQLDELAHYSVLAGYVRELKPGGALLDVGCGDGVFRRHLHPDAFSSYVGIDFPEAIVRSRKYVDARTSFAAADMRTYQPGSQFDAIVFNESLYYVDDPIAELDRYATFLKPDGVFLVSMHRKPKSEKVWVDIARQFAMIDRVTLGNRSDVQWMLGAFKPAPPLPRPQGSG